MRVRRWLIGMLAVTGCAWAQEGGPARTVPAEPHGEVSIVCVSGSVEVTGWDRPQVEVISSDPDAIHLEASGRRVSVRARPGATGNMTLRIHVPAGSSLDLSTVSADATVRGVTGAQWLRTVSGNLDAALAPADMEVKTMSGNLTLHGERSGSHLRVSDVSGDVKLQGGSGALEITGVSGDLQVALRDAQDVRVHTTAGDVHLSGDLAPQANVDGETVSGELSLKAKPADGYRYDVSSFSGEIENCFGQEPVHTSQYAPGSRLDGTRGAGGGHVRLRTLSGTVSICDQ